MNKAGLGRIREWWVIGSTWGLMVEMAHYVDLTKNKITRTLETDQIAQTKFCFPRWCLPSQSYETPPIPDLWLCDHRTQQQVKN